MDWRWPLTRAPARTPSGDLAGMFGRTDDWASLCAARRDPKLGEREEALAYLRAWCDAPPDLALAKALVPLVAARTTAIAAAATIDLATVLEAELAANDALAWLRFHAADHDFVLDALAATYLTTERLADARFTINALKAHRGFGAVACRRAFRELFVADRARRDELRRELARRPDAVCSQLSAHASCTLSWGVEASGTGAAPARIDLDRCTPLLLARPELMPRAYLTIAAAHWPAAHRGFDTWLAFAVFTLGAAEAPRADELIAAAFENAIRLSNCEEQLDLVIETVSHSTLPRVRRLASITRAACERQRGAPPP